MKSLDRDELVERLDAADGWERGMAGLLLSEHDEPETVFALLRHLGDGDSDVRTCLLWALGQAANPLTLAPLLEFARIEKDKIVLSQLAATLYQIVTRSGHGRNKEKEKRARPEELAALEAELLVDPDAELFVARGRLFVKTGQLLKAIGSFSQAHAEHGATSPKALLYRSQSFLLMGKPLYALDDLLACPDEFDYPPMFYLHRAALVTLARQIVSAAKEKGLTDYARLFERRLDKISERKERQSED
jgi:hypothetical protein